MRTHAYLFVSILTACLVSACADTPENGERRDFKTNSSALEPGTPGDSCGENGASTACYTGPEGTKGVGSCKAGTQFCFNGKYTECLKQVLPSLGETCDGADNDCDGSVDEGFNDVTCGQGECLTTVSECVNGQPTDCEIEALLKIKLEVCDGLDNDCNGPVDDAQDGNPLSNTCYTGAAGTQDVGECKAGVETCKDGAFGECDGEVTPSSDLCDSLDNDCDGGVDEDFPNIGQPCSSGTGACKADGEFVCNAAKTGEICNAKGSDPEDETCDKVDNDCDGSTDEDADGNPLAQSCYTGAAGTQDVGECKGGTKTCTDGAFGECVGEVTPVNEDCNDKDDDCDGDSDENPDGTSLTKSCYSGPDGTEGVGTCSAGLQTCLCGVFSGCVAEVTPVSEACADGVDNDCDGEVDKDCAAPCVDEDKDGFGFGCDAGPDCDDADAKVNPNEPEWCGNEKDDNCNSLKDELGCYSTAEGATLVQFKSTGACTWENLFFTSDFGSILFPTTAIFGKQNGFSTNVVFQAGSSGIKALHRFNLEFDLDGALGNDVTYVTKDPAGVVVHDECGTLRFFFEGVELTFKTLLDPRPVPDPFVSANAFVCFGSDDTCFLCGGDWDGNGTPDCDEDDGFCKLDPQDNAACGSRGYLI